MDSSMESESNSVIDINITDFYIKCQEEIDANSARTMKNIGSVLLQMRSKYQKV